MFNGPDLQINIPQTLAALDRSHLDAAIPAVVPIWGQIESVPFVRILGVPRFWQAEEGMDFLQNVEDLVTGVGGQHLPLLFLLIGEPRGIQVYMGLEGVGAEATLRTSLIAAFPGVWLSEDAHTHIGALLNTNKLMAHLGRLTGIPSRKLASSGGQQPSGSTPQPGAAHQIERLIRGLYGQSWGYFVRATPADPAQVMAQRQQLVGQLSAVSGHVDWQHSRQAQDMTTIGPNQQRSESESLNRTVTDYQAKRCLALLERQVERFDAGRAQGMWHVETHIFTAAPATMGQARALLGAIFAGPDSTPEPVRTFACLPSGQATEVSTLLHSGELATLVHLPREEFPGYRVAAYARFDTDPLSLAACDAAEGVNIGKIMEGERPTGNWFIVPRRDFAKHGLVVGVTGSGKTNTVFYILDKLWEGGQGAPFLVIEPAKAEYRDLRCLPSLESLKVYTLGDETVAPFRLNPFEFEVGPAHRIHVQTHIDYLKSVFNAAFILYAPMPYVLETCLHEVYEDRGWDLTTGFNHRLPPEERGNESRWPVFPTLSDLYDKINEVVERLGYEERIKMDVRAGLQTRVGSLMLGSKGLMLNTQHSVPFSELLALPTVLELERIGNDDEKSFLIGIILTRLYEYRRLQNLVSGSPQHLRHVAVFEEAHRLLKNVPMQVETEGANVRGQAVEVFANMLSEIRAYGQGVLIAEQVPTKLAPDAVKNTNLKLMHRIVAQDDRDVMGGAMNLDENQQRAVASLPVGRAVAYAEGADAPYLLEIIDYKRRLAGKHVTDRVVAQAMQDAIQSTLYEPAPGYGRYIARSLGYFDPSLWNVASRVMRHADFQQTWARYFFSVALKPHPVTEGYAALLHVQRGVTGGLGLDVERQTMLALALIGANRYFDVRGRAYDWLYPVVEELREQFVAIAVEVIQGFENDQAALAHLAQTLIPRAEAFGQTYTRHIAREVGPFAGCAFCANRCLYRYEVATLLGDKTVERDFSRVIQETQDDQAMWRQLAQLVQSDIVHILPVGAYPEVVREAALCYAIQIGSKINIGHTQQHRLVKNLRDALRT